VVDEVARRHPDVTQIIAHLGHPWQRETIVTVRKNRRVFADVSASWARPLDGYLALTRAQEWGVVDKLLFGSDFPIWTPAQAATELRQLAASRPEGLPPIEPATVEWLLDGDPRATLGL
jgi:predicted TIM-barrel fold metal-dependent hydrolase